MSDTNINDGGPAFPVAGHCVDASGAYCGDVVNSKGLSLRDWFAGQALAGLVQNGQYASGQIAQSAYSFADAMLAVRNKKE